MKNTELFQYFLDYEVELNGRGGEIWTPDILLPKQARYRTALHPE